MTNKLATLTTQDDISIITLDDGKANVFSPSMISDVNSCLGPGSHRIWLPYNQGKRWHVFCRI
jgi:hypothetical protein